MLSAVIVDCSCGKPVDEPAALRELVRSVCLWDCLLAGPVHEPTALVFSLAVVVIRRNSQYTLHTYEYILHTLDTYESSVRV